MFWVISVYFNIRNTLPKSGTFLLGHPVYYLYKPEFSIVAKPVPVAARSKACWDCGFESHRGHGCLSVVSIVCCQVEVLLRADHSSRGVLPTVVRRCVWSRNLVNEEALAHWGLLRQKQQTCIVAKFTAPYLQHLECVNTSSCCIITEIMLLMSLYYSVRRGYLVLQVCILHMTYVLSTSYDTSESDGSQKKFRNSS